MKTKVVYKAIKLKLTARWLCLRTSRTSLWNWRIHLLRLLSLGAKHAFSISSIVLSASSSLSFLAVADSTPLSHLKLSLSRPSVRSFMLRKSPVSTGIGHSSGAAALSASRCRRLMFLGQVYPTLADRQWTAQLSWPTLFWSQSRLATMLSVWIASSATRDTMCFVVCAESSHTDQTTQVKLHFSMMPQSFLSTWGLCCSTDARSPVFRLREWTWWRLLTTQKSHRVCFRSSKPSQRLTLVNSSLKALFQSFRMPLPALRNVTFILKSITGPTLSNAWWSLLALTRVMPNPWSVLTTDHESHYSLLDILHLLSILFR